MTLAQDGMTVAKVRHAQVSQPHTKAACQMRAPASFEN